MPIIFVPLKIKDSETVAHYMDLEDYDKFYDGKKWFLTKDGYVCQFNYKTNRRVFLHRVITNCPAGMVVDHQNHVRGDNRRSNLRVCTKAENQANRTKTSRNTSGFKGVSWNAQSKKWKACSHCNGKNRTIGYFRNPEDAAIAYDLEVKFQSSTYAYTNFEWTVSVSNGSCALVASDRTTGNVYRTIPVSSIN